MSKKDLARTGPERRRPGGCRRGSVAAAIGLVATLAAAACSSSSTAGQAGASSAAENRTITLAVATLAPQTPDPDLAWGNTFEIRYDVGEGLVRPNTSGIFVPALATSWDVSSNKLTWTFHLRSGVEMQDGSAFTAQDVETAVNRITDATQWASYAGLKANLASVQVVDPLTVKITTKTPDGALPQEAPAPIATAYYKRVGEQAFEQHPIAAGPFKFVSQVLNNSMTFDVFKGFWDKSRVPNFSRLVLKVIPEESTRLAALQSGQIDLAPFTPQSVSQLKSADNVTTVTSQAVNQVGIYFPDNYSGKNTPLRDQRVREALLLAIDRNSIAKSLYSGYAQVPGSPLFPTAAGYDKSVQPYPYDPSKAKQLLQQAGAADLSFTLNTYNASNGVPQVQSLVQAIVGYWKAIGINVTLNELDPATYLPKVLAHQYSGGEVLGSPAEYENDPYELQTFYESDGAYATVKDPTLDGLLAKVRSSIDPTERAANAKTMAAYLYKELYGIPILNTDAVFGYGPKIAKFTPMVGDPFTSLWTSIVAS
jgi:peptide/nickel transport system substrate-binding protein